MRIKSRFQINVLVVAMALAGLLFAGTGTAQDMKLSLAELKLTPAEISWINTRPLVRVGGPRQFPLPFL